MDKITENWNVKIKKPEMLSDATHLADAEMPYPTGLGMLFPVFGILSNDAFQDPIKYPNLTRERSYRDLYFEPFQKNFITNVGSLILTTTGGFCATLHLQAMECLEYYGMKKGHIICKDYFDDFEECKQKHVQNLRIRAMQTQLGNRYKEYLKGERKYEDVYYELPKAHSYNLPNKFNQVSHDCGNGTQF